MSSSIYNDVSISDKLFEKDRSSKKEDLTNESALSQISNVQNSIEHHAIESSAERCMSPNRGRRLLISPLPSNPDLLTYPQNKPKWYNDAHHSLVQLATYNQQKPLSKEELLKIQATAEQVIATKDQMQSLLFLKLLSEFSFCGSAEIFFHMLQSLRNANPDINQYFNDISIKSLTHPMLNEKAIAQILHFFSEEYGYPKGILRTAAASQIPSLVEQIIEAKEDSIRGWAVSNDQDPYDPHIVPVFAIRKKGKTHVFIFDSVGHRFSTKTWQQQISASLENLIEHFQDQSDIFDRLAIYSYRFQRQTSDFDCAAFTLLDLKNLLEMHLQDDSNIIDFYQLQKENLRPEFSIQNLDTTTQLPVFELLTLPPQMMKTTQSFQQIDRYKRKLPEVPFISIVRRYADMTSTCEKVQDIGELLTRVQSSTRINSKNKPQNLYAEQKHMQLIVYLLSDSILQFERDSSIKKRGNAFSQSSKTPIPE